MAKKYNTRGTKKQELTAARAELKQFRHDVAQLKKFGLIDKKYDARSISPTKYLRGEIKKFGNVLAGEAQAVKVSKEKLKYYREKDYEIKSGRVIVPKKSNEKIYATRGDFRTVTIHPSGKITKVDLGLSNKNVAKWREQLASKKIKLRPGERIAFQFYGNNSYQTFLDTAQLLDYLERYDAIETISKSRDSDAVSDVINNVVIFKVERSDAWEKTPFEGTDKQTRQLERNRVRRERWFSHMSNDQYNKFMDKRASYEKMRRAEMKKNNPEKYAAEKIKSAARVKKSRANKSKKII